MAKTAVIAGASGFIGRSLTADFASHGYTVKRIGRGEPHARWGDSDSIRRVLEGADVVVNLAGKSVNCRYTDRNRAEVLRSRTDTSRELRGAIAACETPPRVWINASTATIYRHAMDRPMTETAGEYGTGFSVDVARSWERELFADELPETRRVALRIAIVLGDGPATAMLLALARLGLGGAQHDGWWFPHRRYRGIGPDPSGDGSAPMHHTRGRQRFSWVHINDVLGAIRHVIAHPELDGPVNVASPNPSDNRSLMATLRKVVRQPIGLPAFRWMLEPAMWLLRTEPELVLKSRWVLPERLSASGYVFRWPELEPALRDVAASRGQDRAEA
ncbi:epimerase [Ruicaihuangia caeni]|uniref:DUF1731 domain-containing protein n=1 Tax=Ruicaihuangia caeni TaxID=3042517 RepID=A0AAW6T4E9_9MICO|nr:DUF1731 domain-containing protein [Klugiella sp. YN-L-19]MDI2098184.1 DUF1731 domain-containing protein [Klugiella sp. YN-L-19]